MAAYDAPLHLRVIPQVGFQHFNTYETGAPTELYICTLSVPGEDPAPSALHPPCSSISPIPFSHLLGSTLLSSSSADKQHPLTWPPLRPTDPRISVATPISHSYPHERCNSRSLHAYARGTYLRAWASSSSRLHSDGGGCREISRRGLQTTFRSPPAHRA